MSVFIIGGLVWNTRKAKLQAVEPSAAAAGKPKLTFLQRLSSFLNKGSSETMSALGKVDKTPATSSLEAGPVSVVSESMMAQWKAAFSLFDEDASGEVSSAELGSVMRALGQKPTDGELTKMVAEVDADNSGQIDFDEFCLLMAKKMREESAGDAGASTGFAGAVKNVENELASMGGDGVSMEERVKLLREKLERQRKAAAMWTAAYADGDGADAGELPTEADTPASEPPNMEKFVALCCLFKLVVTPALCIAFNQLLYAAGAIPDNPMMRLILDLYPCIPTAAALVARFSAGGFDDAARYCATCMLPMYLLSIPSIAAYIVLSVVLIGDGAAPVAINTTLNATM